MAAVDKRVHIFGIRHHGPGSARSLRAALERLQPDALIIEGPPEANELLPLALHEEMVPPVALLIYARKNPSRAAYYPFTEHSPEWQAIQYGLRRQIPVRMMDLAQAAQMALADQSEPEEPADGPVNEAGPQEPEPRPDEKVDVSEPAGETPPPETQQEDAPPAVDTSDPLRMLAEAAGYADGEQWWDHMVEHYRGQAGEDAAENLFAAILEAMCALREEAPPDLYPLTTLREAAMRTNAREALRQGAQRLAVVCGAWHAPALLDLETTAEEDERLLKGLKREEVQATWVPWSNNRLTRASGYGAGIDAPGWYSHLWRTEEQVASRWLIGVGRMLREEGLDISPGHIIEAVRLAESLAALRDRPLPGLPELQQAALSVFCFGNPTPLRLIEEKLIIGEAMGSVPAETPAAPLQHDFEQQTRRLRLKPEPTERLIDLDLRKPLDLERSHLLHRLLLLEVQWGRPGDRAQRGGKNARGGTFHELWRLKWWPEFALQLIEAGQWGSTIAAAASARAVDLATRAPDLASLTGIVEDVLLAELPNAVGQVMARLQHLAAVSSDTRRLMEALPPLAAVLRYGSVRQMDAAMVAEVVDGLVARICIGLPTACTGLNDDAAGEMFNLVCKVDDALARLDNPEYNPSWQRTLASLADMPGMHGLLAGRACRILMDCGAQAPEEAARRLSLALSPAVEPSQAAAWLEGFLHGSGQILIHDDALLGIIDRWLTDLPPEIFPRLLPLLRRTFSSCAPPERRVIGERIRGAGRGTGSGPDGQENFDHRRADAVLPLIARLLGVPAAEEWIQGPQERAS